MLSELKVGILENTDVFSKQIFKNSPDSYCVQYRDVFQLTGKNIQPHLKLSKPLISNSISATVEFYLNSTRFT